MLGESNIKSQVIDKAAPICSSNIGSLSNNTIPDILLTGLVVPFVTMLFINILPFIAVAGAASTRWSYSEGGYRFLLAGPEHPAPKSRYEQQTCAYTIGLLSQKLGLETPSGISDWKVCKSKLASITSGEAPEDFLELLKTEIKDADNFWHSVKANSSATGWVPVDGRGIAFLPNVTAATFAAWSQSPLADKANNILNSEHYIKRTIKDSDGIIQSDIVEGWGGVTTHFTIKGYGPPDFARHPMIRRLPEFPIQAAGDKVLVDGTNEIFGVLHIAIRDVNGTDYGVGDKKGVDVFASVWYHDGVSNEHLEQERQHIVVEIVNGILQVQKDIDSGAFVMPRPI